MSDLISRSAIYKYVKSEINLYGKPFEGSAYELGLKIMEFIENMETVEAAPVVHGEWIPVAERLPKEDTEVIVSTKRGTVRIGSYTTRYGFNRGEGFICSDCFVGINTVNAWMLLPEPFKESD